MTKKRLFVMAIALVFAFLLAGCGSKVKAEPQMMQIIEAPTTKTTEPAASTATTDSSASSTESSTIATTEATTTTSSVPPEQPKSELDLYKEESIRLVGNKKQLNGIDISEYQSGQNWKGYIDESDAVILRYSAGTSKDDCFDEMMAYAKEKHKLVGIYFFTNNITWRDRDPAEYARWCIDQTRDYLGYAVYVLDAEGGNILDTNWILTYLRTFKEETGIKPVLYTGQHKLNQAASTESTAEAMRTIRSESYGLWIARYGENDGEVYEFEVFLWEENKVFGHQYVSAVEHLDRDIFFCTPEAWYKYAQTS